MTLLPLALTLEDIGFVHSVLTVLAFMEYLQTGVVIRLLERLLIVGVLALAFLLASLPADNSDVWLHLASGRLLAHGQYSFGVDPFTFTTGSVYWVNPSWLYDWLSFLLFQSGGGATLTIVKAALMTLLGWILIRLSCEIENEKRSSNWIAVVFATFALLIIGSAMPLRPICVSYLFLALTLWLLESHLAGERPLSLAWLWLIPLLFALWANLDAWFVLGPLTVGLYFLGMLLVGDKYTGQRCRFGSVFLVGLAGCLFNPYHFRVFDLPLLFPFTAKTVVLGHDPVFGQLLQSPWDFSFLRGAWGREVPHVGQLLYYPLVLVAIASFFLNGIAGARSACFRRLLVCLFFFALSAWDASTIPLLAIVATPLTALNFQEYVLRRQIRRPPAPLWTIGSRILVLILVTGLLTVAWPGWLQGQRHQPRGWFIQTDKSLVEAVQQVVRWRQAGLFQPTETGFNFSPTAAHYFAWFAPEEKSFCAAPWRSGAAVLNDYVRVRCTLLGSSSGASVSMFPDGAATRDILRKYRVAYLLLHDSDVLRTAAVFQRLAALGSEWPILFLKGDTIVLGWRDPARSEEKDHFAGWRLDFHRRAFQPTEDEKAPERGPLPESTSPDWRSYKRIASSAASHDRDEAALYLIYFDILRPSFLAHHRLIWEHSLAAGIVAAGPGLSVLPLSSLDFATFQVSRVGPRPRAEGGIRPLDAVAMGLTENYDRQQDYGPPELLLLAVRAARRAINDNPHDAEAYHLLGQAYLRLMYNSRERLAKYDLPSLAHVRRIQAVCAFHQSLLLQPDQLQTHLNLYSLYQDMGLLDFALQHARQVLRLSRTRRKIVDETQESKGQRLQQTEEWVRQLEETVQQHLDNYELQAARRPVLEQAFLAREQGLGSKALDILLASDVAVFGKRGAELELELLLAAGRIKEAREWLAPSQEIDLDQDSYQRFRILVAAIDGDYQTCAKELTQLAASLDRPMTVVINVWKVHPVVRALQPSAGQKTEAVLKLLPRQALALDVAQLIGEMPLQRQTIPWLLTTQLEKAGLLEIAQTIVTKIRQRAERDVLRGALALERGDTTEAESSLRRALSVWKSETDAASGSGLDFDGRRTAQVLLEWLSPRLVFFQ